MKTCKVNILGSVWRFDYIAAEEDKTPILGVSGYCDPTVKRIVVYKAPKDATVRDVGVTERATARHEVLHAYLYESGLGEEMRGVNGHDEQIIDWFANQAMKIYGTYRELGVLR